MAARGGAGGGVGTQRVRHIDTKIGYIYHRKTTWTNLWAVVVVVMMIRDVKTTKVMLFGDLPSKY